MIPPAPTHRQGRFILPAAVLVTLLAVPALFALRLTAGEQRHLLQRWEFWLLEGLFVCVVVTTIIEIRHVRVDRRLLVSAAGVGALAWILSSSLAPRTNRIRPDFH